MTAEAQTQVADHAWIGALAESWQRTSTVQLQRAGETVVSVANGHYNMSVAFDICARELRRRAQEVSAANQARRPILNE